MSPTSFEGPLFNIFCRPLASPLLLPSHLQDLFLQCIPSRSLHRPFLKGAPGHHCLFIVCLKLLVSIDVWWVGPQLRELARGQLQNVPVKAEHRGQELGRVVSSFVDGEGRLNCVMRIAEETVEGAIAAGLVKDGIARELSLGYSVDVAHTGQKLQAGAKRVLEVSLVRKGAREACFVTAFEAEGGQTHFARTQENPWALFDLP